MSTLIIIIILVFSSDIKAQVQTNNQNDPNYNFSLDGIKPYLPMNKFDAAQDLFKNAEIIQQLTSLKVYRLTISQLRYKFPIYIQVKDGEIVDFYTTLPSYFLHDVFHQSLINRYGKQDQYLKHEANALYVWNKKEIRHTYSGTCTITCFALYYTATKSTLLSDKTFRPLITVLNQRSLN